MNSGVSTVHVAEQWRHGAEGEEEEGEGLVIPLLQGAPLLLCCNTVATKAAPSCFEEGERGRGRAGYPSAARRAIVYCVATRLQQKQPQATSKIEATGLEILLASKI